MNMDEDNGALVMSNINFNIVKRVHFLIIQLDFQKEKRELYFSEKAYPFFLFISEM